MLTIVSVVTIAAVARPLAEAYSEKLKAEYKAIGSEELNKLKQRLESLENELLEVKGQLKSFQETNDFATKLLETGDLPSAIKLLKQKN
jgi:hypothetical protein